MHNQFLTNLSKVRVSSSDLLTVEGQDADTSGLVWGFKLSKRQTLLWG